MKKKNIGVVYYPGPKLSARGKFNRKALDPLVKRIGAEKVKIDAYWPFPDFEFRDIPILTYIDSWATTMQYRRKLYQAARQYDVLFISSQDFLWIDPEVANSTIIPYVHDIFPATTLFSSKLELNRARKYLTNVVKCSEIVCASEETKRDVYHRTPFDGEATVIYQGVEQPCVQVSNRSIDLLYVGSVIERKDPTFLRESIALAAKSGFNCVAVNFKEIDLPCKVLSGVSGRQLAEVYASSNYYLHPSKAEGFGRSPVEAQTHGTIPLGRDISINHEILGEEGKDWHSVSTPNDVVNIIEREVPRWQRRAATENAERFSWNKTVEGLSAVLSGNSL
ncbi:glycosyltransferase [Halohasta salina]|uniref:glycosyltransferase n=1 Tax=Halohasta salina TaxID=2961621 RepID=UPI0020A2EB0C|nr:glycosyltransferase [Halohasta salina]